MNEKTMKINELFGDIQEISPLYKPSEWNFPEYPSVDMVEYLLNTGKFKVKNVDPRSLISNQKFINANMVKQYINEPDLGTTRKAIWHQYPIVIEYANKYYVFGGNHRAVAALESHKLLKARVVDYYDTIY